ncbi:glutamate--cysteine ligase, partial [Vibrio harveyi]
LLPNSQRGNEQK